jgi:hypothetical protein
VRLNDAKNIEPFLSLGAGPASFTSMRPSKQTLNATRAALRRPH